MWRSLTGYRPAVPFSDGECALTAAGDRLLAVDRRTLSSSVLDGHGFRPFAPAPVEYDARFDGQFDPTRTLFAASADRLYMLDAWGALWHAPEGEPLQRLTAPDDGPGGRPAHHSTFVWDAAQRRLVLFGDLHANDTWAFDGRWRIIESDVAPPAGPARCTSTPQGVHLLCRGELWCLLVDTWLRLHVDAGLHAAALMRDPRRDVLLAVGSTVAVFDRDGFRHVAAVPPTGGARDAVGLDPLGDRLVRLTDHGIETLGLSSLVLAQPRRRDSDTWLGQRPYDA